MRISRSMGAIFEWWQVQTVSIFTNSKLARSVEIRNKAGPFGNFSSKAAVSLGSSALRSLRLLELQDEVIDRTRRLLR
jgi:hypothetical protein